MIDIKKLVKVENFNEWTVLSILLLVAGLAFWIGWGVHYSVWMDLGVYSFSAFLIFGGLFGFLLSLAPKKT